MTEHWDVVVVGGGIHGVGVAQAAALDAVTAGAGQRQHQAGLALGVLQAAADLGGQALELAGVQPRHEDHRVVERVRVVLPLVGHVVGGHQHADVLEAAGDQHLRQAQVAGHGQALGVGGAPAVLRTSVLGDVSYHPVLAGADEQPVSLRGVNLGDGASFKIDIDGLSPDSHEKTTQSLVINLSLGWAAGIGAAGWAAGCIGGRFGTC